MKFSGKMCFKIILKVTKKQGFTVSLEDTFFEKPQPVFGLRQFVVSFRIFHVYEVPDATPYFF